MARRAVTIGCRHDRLPLPRDVGDSLAAYLSHACPVTTIRRVLMAVKAPRRPTRADLVSDVTRRACERAGLPPVGAHPYGRSSRSIREVQVFSNGLLNGFESSAVAGGIDYGGRKSSGANPVAAAPVPGI